MRRQCWAAALTVMAAAAAMRAWVNFGAAWPAGMDGGYYPLQARALLVHGRLAYADLPLVFALDAGLARLLMLVARLPLDDAVVLAARLIDTFVPPLVVLPLLALGRRLGCAPWRLAAAAACAAVSLPMLRMAGDYEKNSVGLVGLAGLAWALHAAYSPANRSATGRWAMVGGVLVLAGLTHVAVLGAAVVLGACTVGAYAWWEHPPSQRRALAGLAVAGVAFGCVLVVSPHRALRLLAAPVLLFWRHGGAPPLDPVGRLTAAAVWASLAWGGLTLRRERATATAADVAVLCGAAGCAALLACPLLAEEYFKRLVLMAPVPAALALGYALDRCEARWPAWVVGGAAVLSVGLGLIGGGLAPTVITDDEALELRSWRPLLAGGPRTVVLADKGLMWWAGLLLDTPVRQHRAQPEALAKYERVLWLTAKQPHHPPEPPRPGPPPTRGAAPLGGARRAGETLRDGVLFRLSVAELAARGQP